MTVADLPLANRWLASPAVREWWIEADGTPSPPFDAAYLAEPSVSAWIVELGGEPFAFLQDYDPHAVADHHFASLPPGSRGVDQFIGVAALVGCGHGSAFVRLHVERLLEAGAPAVGTDPHPGNARAIRAYEKAGFRRVETRRTEWGPALLMVRRREDGV